MPRIAMIGAGSMVFARNLISDILSFPELADSEFALMDINEKRLQRTEEAAEILANKSDHNPTFESTLDQREAIEDADYVLNMINVGGIEPFENEIRIPEKYGVGQAIGDTLGPGGVFRGMRSIPVMKDIVSDMEDLAAPDAIHVNYSNPMAINCWAVNEFSDVPTVGLCHSVPYNIRDVADYVDLPQDELSYCAAGINHLAWFLQIKHEPSGKDVTKLLQEAQKNPEIFEKDNIRFEMMDYFGKFMTESSHHLSEYLPYYRTDEKTIEDYTGEFRARRMPTGHYLEHWRENQKKMNESADPDTEVEMTIHSDELEISQSVDYTSPMLHSLETGTERRLHLNLPNNGAIGNLHPNACVEIPALVDGTGIHQVQIGDLPPQMAAIVRSNINVQELAVKAALEGDVDSLYQALMVDPLTGACCTPDEIYEMTEELLEANSEWLPQFN